MTILPLVQQALMAGFGEEQILNFLSKTMPGLSKGINSAKSGGFDPAKILRFLSYAAPRGKKEKIQQQESLNDKYLSGIGLKTRAERDERRNKVLKGALGVGAGILGATALKDIASKKNKPPIPTGSAQATGGATPLLAGAAEGAQIPVPGNMPPQGQQAPLQTTQQPIQPNQAAAPQAPQSNSVDILRQMGIADKAKTLAAAGNTPEAIATALNLTLRPHQKKWLEERVKAGQSKPLEGLVADYMANPQADEGPKGPEATGTMSANEEPLAKPEVGHLVATPEGHIGELKSIRNKDALIEADGRLHKVPADQLESLTHKYSKVEFNMDQVPEKDRSGALYSVSPNRDNSALKIEYFPSNENSPHDEYEYFRKDGKPFDEDLLNDLREGADVPVSSGVTWAGIWSENTPDSRGSTNHHRIKMQAQDIDKVQSGTEEDDPSKPFFFKKIKKIFEHGASKQIKSKFGKNQAAFAKEYRELTRERKRKE